MTRSLSEVEVGPFEVAGGQARIVDSANSPAASTVAAAFVEGFLAYLDREGLANMGAWVNANIHVGHWRPNIDVPLYASGIYGLIILVVMLFRPEGLIPSRRVAAEMHEGVHDEPLYDVAHGAEGV